MTTTLLTALRQYRHNNGEDFVFGYDKEETDRIVAGLIEDRDQQYAMKCRAREQRDKLAAPVRFCEDTALSLAGRTFSTEVDEQLAEDIIQYARRLHDMYAIPQPTVQGEPVGRIKTIGGYPDESEHTIEWLCKYKYLKDGDLLYTTTQPTVQPAPDVAKLVEALEGLLAIVSDSSGVAGYHLNGDIAQWSEFEEVEIAEEALALYRKQGGDV